MKLQCLDTLGDEPACYAIFCFLGLQGFGPYIVIHSSYAEDCAAQNLRQLSVMV